MKINKISMAGFRGATVPVELTFDPTKSVTLIFGENGTGKSTIGDAFDFLCNGGYGSLENYSLGEPAKKYMASLGTRSDSVKVTLSSSSSTWTATLGREGRVITPKTGYPDARILRRRAILKLIEAKPKDRFEELRAFIAVPNIDKSEAALREAVRITESGFNETSRALSQAREMLEELWTKESKPGASALDWAESETAKDLTQVQASLREVSNLESGFGAVDTSLALLDDSRKSKSQAELGLEETERKLKAAEAQQADRDAELVKLLEEARTYIERRKSLTRCPVCENEIIVVDLLRRLQERIKEMLGIKTLADMVTAARRNVETKTSLVAQNQGGFCAKVKALAIAFKASILAEVLSLNVDWEDFRTLFSEAPISDSLEAQAQAMLQAVSPCRERLQIRKEADQKTVSNHNAIKGYVDTLRSKKAQAKSQEMQLKKLKVINEIVSRERKDYIEGILARISSEVERLYLKIHPDEGIGQIRFYLKPNTIGSLEFDARFQNVAEVLPQAYYSESHLDTLGICVFLALAKFYKTNNTIVLLDDVLTSVDGPHLQRFMELLHEEALHFNQFIVTTHYRPWRDLYRWARGPVGNTQLIELGPWDLKNGLNIGEFADAITELRSILESTSFDRQGAASKAGIVLESLLDFLTLKYHCPVPRNAGNEYTLGDLTRGIDSKLGKELRSRKPPSKGAAKTDLPLKSLIDSITSRTWVRNSVGCHFGALGSEVSDPDVKAFCGEVLHLAGTMICSSCRRLPTRKPSGSFWQCQCGELELYPLVYPGINLGSVDDEQ